MLQAVMSVLDRRTMLHPPRGRGKAAFSQPGPVISRIVRAFEETGGDGDELAATLNRCLPADWTGLSRSDLIAGNQDYSLEFYFYVVMFTKAVLEDPGFCVPVNSQLQYQESHYTFEAGPLTKVPWRNRDEGLSDEYLSIVNMKAMFAYTERNASAPPFFDGNAADAGGRISRETLDLLNAMVPQDRRVKRQFFDREEVLISYEYLFRLAQIFMCLLNDPDFAEHSLYYGFKNSNVLARVVFLQPEHSIAEGLRRWQMRTNNVYMLEFRESRRSTQVRFNLRRHHQLDIFGPYWASSIRGIQQANLGILRAFAELSTSHPASSRLVRRKSGAMEFTIQVRWRPPMESQRYILAAAGLGLGIVGGIVYGFQHVSTHWMILAALVTGFVVVGGATALALYWRSRLRHMYKRFSDAKRIINTQVDTLTRRTEELLNERDVLEEKVADRTTALEGALKQVKQLDSVKTNFLANVSHELRTPLTLLSIPFEEIQDGRWGETLPNTHQVFDLIGRNISRIRIQVDRLLDFTRLDLNAMEFQPEPTDLADYCRLVVSELHPYARKRGLELKFEDAMKKSRTFVEADRKLLETALLNLLVNAIKFTRKGSVTLALTPDGRERVALEVRDTGIGIAEDQLDRIFERFTQIDSNKERRYEGSGIGLSLVAGIAGIHSWSLSVESEIGTGSTFRLAMPRRFGPTLPTAKSVDLSQMVLPESDLELPPEPLDEPTDINRDSVLIVEDNPDMGTVLQIILRDDFNVHWCRDAITALDFVAGNPAISLILCDVMMPGMSGFGFIQELSRRGICSEIPVVFLTALDDIEDRLRGLDCGAVDYISKPFSRSELLMKVRNLISSRNASYLQALRDREGVDRLNVMAANRSPSSVARTVRERRDEYGVTAAEVRVIELLRDGLQDKEIARKLSLSPRTVSTHLSHVYEKTGTQNRVELLQALYGVGTESF